MIKVGETFYLMIMIDGKEVPIQTMGFNPLQMHSSVIFSQPVGKLVLADKYGYFDKNPMADGAKVDIFVGKNESKTQAYQYRFRLFRYIVTKSQNVNYYTLMLAFNCPRYFNENSVGSIKGTSSEVMSQIAQTIGVTYSGDSTSDSQVWLGTGLKRCLFARDVALHGYADDQSCMMLGMTLLGELRYRNVSKINLAKTEIIFIQGTGGNQTSYRVLDRKEISKAGLANNMVGYKMETVEQNPNSAVDVTNHNIVKVPLNTGPTLSVNKTLNDNLQGSRVVMTPVSSGNVHTNYYKAEHQNVRLKNTYALGMHIVTDGMTGVDLFDPVKYLFYDNTSNELKLNQVISGGYIITAKTIYATKEGKYYEKLELMRQGVNFYNTVSSVITANNSAVSG